MAAAEGGGDGWLRCTRGAGVRPRKARRRINEMGKFAGLVVNSSTITIRHYHKHCTPFLIGVAAGLVAVAVPERAKQPLLVSSPESSNNQTRRDQAQFYVLECGLWAKSRQALVKHIKMNS